MTPIKIGAARRNGRHYSVAPARITAPRAPRNFSGTQINWTRINWPLRAHVRRASLSPCALCTAAKPKRCGAVLPSVRPCAHPAKVFSNNFEGTPANVLPPLYHHAQTDAPLRMMYYAHTAEDPEGKRLPECSGKWQPLRTHLENVANLAKRFSVLQKIVLR